MSGERGGGRPSLQRKKAGGIEVLDGGLGCILRLDEISRVLAKLRCFDAVLPVAGSFRLGTVGGRRHFAGADRAVGGRDGRGLGFGLRDDAVVSGWRGRWVPVLAEQKPVLLGKSGLAWGRGILPEVPPREGRHKVEGDGKTPAGVFEIGLVFGYASAPPPGTRLAYRQVTEWDCWVENEENPLYNQHVVIDPSKGVPSWHEQERMKMGDQAHSLKLEIRHNADPPRPGMGSAIFFHIRRGPERRTAGCTTMKREDLEALIRWLDPEAAPHLV